MSTLRPHPSLDVARSLNREHETYGSFGERRLQELCHGLNLGQTVVDEATRVFRHLTQSWWRLALEGAPGWRTDITDEGSPFEFSIAFDGGVSPTFRMIAEAQESPLTLVSSWRAGLKVNERLRQLGAADLGRFDRIQDLFAPTKRARFALWHGAVVQGNAPTSYKVYLNPLVRGPHHAKATVTEALSRLEVGVASRFFRTRLSPQVHPTQLLYLSLDLASDPGARVKLYVAHQRATAGEIEPFHQDAGNYVSGDATRWLQGILASEGPFERRPIISCFSFTAAETRPTVTLHMPIREYVHNDAVSVERACEFLSVDGARAFRHALERYASRSLASGRGLLTYLSLRRFNKGVSVSAYVSPEAFVARASRSGSRRAAVRR